MGQAALPPSRRLRSGCERRLWPGTRPLCPLPPPPCLIVLRCHVLCPHAARCDYMPGVILQRQLKHDRPVRQILGAPGLLTRRAFSTGASQKQNSVHLRAGGQPSGEEGHTEGRPRAAGRGLETVQSYPTSPPQSILLMQETEAQTGRDGPKGIRHEGHVAQWARGGTLEPQ